MKLTLETIPPTTVEGTPREVPVAVFGCGSLHRVHMVVRPDQLTEQQWTTLADLWAIKAVPQVYDSDLTELRVALDVAREQLDEGERILEVG